MNCTFENDGGHIFIDAGESPFTIKNVKIDGKVIRNVEQLRRAGAGFDISVPVRFAK